MSKRNIAWLVVIVVAGVLVAFVVGVWWGVATAAVVLVVSEIVERIARVRRRQARADN